MIITPEDIKSMNGRMWPHTLDFPSKYQCSTCPRKEPSCQIPGGECSNNLVWIVPQHYYEGNFGAGK